MLQPLEMIRRSNIIIKKIIDYIPWAFMAVLIGMFLAQTFQIASLDQEAQALSREVATLQAEQEYIQSQIEGQALSKERVDMITYFKITPETLFSEAYTPKGIKVKTLVFRDNDETCNIDVISLDSRSRFVCYEQWSIPDNKKDYKQSLKELRSFAGRSVAAEDGAKIFAEYERQREKERPECSVYENLSMLF